MNIKTKPLGVWPKAITTRRKRSAFTSTYAATMELLKSELQTIYAKDPAIYLAIDARKFRQDGLPFSGTKPATPQVILEYTYRGKTYSLPCDTYDDWEDNLRAIALTLQALRSVERWGVVKGEQYSGLMLEAPSEDAQAKRAAEAIFRLICLDVDFEQEDATHKMVTDIAFMESMYRMAAKKVHPDHTGSSSAMVLLNDQVEVLRRHHKGRS